MYTSMVAIVLEDAASVKLEGVNFEDRGSK